jgi:TonB family protein
MKSPTILCLLILCAVCATEVASSHPQEMPRVKKRVDPQYPFLLKKAGVEGEVDIKVVVSEQGTVDKAELIKASNTDFVPAAMEAAKLWEFIPAEKDGKPIRAEVIIPFKFTMGKGAYKSRFDGLDRAQVGVENLLKGEVAESLKSYINPEAYAVIGDRYEHLTSLISEKSKRGLIVDGPGSKIEFSSTIIDDSEDTAFMVIKNRPAKGKPDRYHTVIFMKTLGGEWKIRAWHTSP